MTVYVVTSGEFTNCPEESSVMVRGVFANEKDAIREKKLIRDLSLVEFKEEYVYSDSDTQTILKMSNDNEYEFRIDVSKFYVM